MAIHIYIAKKPFSNVTSDEVHTITTRSDWNGAIIELWALAMKDEREYAIAWKHGNPEGLDNFRFSAGLIPEKNKTEIENLVAKYNKDDIESAVVEALNDQFKQLMQHAGNGNFIELVAEAAKSWAKDCYQ